MRKQTIYKQYKQKITLLLLGLGLILLSWMTPVEAANNSTELETQVLEIIRNHPEVINEAFQAYIKQQQDQQQQAFISVVQKLKTDPEIIIGNSPVTGASQQKIILLEFSDFQCPYCAEAYSTLKKFMARHQEEVTLVFKNLPLPAAHPEAIASAKAAWAAGQQGKFWPYHDALFTQQDKLSENFYSSVAKKLNLDLEKFNRDRQSFAADAAIQEDIQMAQYLKIRGTPFLILNEEVLPGAYPLDSLEKALENVKNNI